MAERSSRDGPGACRGPPPDPSARGHRREPARALAQPHPASRRGGARPAAALHHDSRSPPDASLQRRRGVMRRARLGGGPARCRARRRRPADRDPRLQPRGARSPQERDRRLSRSPRASALNGKPAALGGASPGMTGTARARSQLRQAFGFTSTYAMTQPEVLVARAHEKARPDRHVDRRGHSQRPDDVPEGVLGMGRALRGSLIQPRQRE